MSKRVIALGEQTRSLLNPILENAKAAMKTEKGSYEHFVFASKAELAKDLYNEYKIAHSKLKLESEEEESLQNLQILTLNIQDIYTQIHGALLFLTAPIEEPNSTSTTGNVKLPRITLKNFSGDTREFPTYIDVFKSLIHNNDSLSNIDKFQYLISTLSSEPLDLVKTLPLTSDNYMVAFETLVKRYQNRRILASSYWNSIFNAPKATESEQSLRELLNCFSENLSALKVYDIDLWDFTLLNLLLQKLDAPTRKRFELEYSDVEVPTFDNLQSFLLKQCKALEANSQCLVSGSGQNISRSIQPKNRSTNHAHRSLIVSTPKLPTCVFCKGNHQLIKCPDFLAKSPLCRFSIIKRNNLCLNCLGQSHHLKACPSRFTCRVCDKKHNTLIHFPKLDQDGSSRVSPKTSSSVSHTNVVPEQADSLLPKGPIVGVVKSKSSPTTVLLATALVSVQDRFGNLVTCRAIIDNGSQVCCVRESLFRRLGLPRTSKSSSICGISGMATPTQKGVSICRISPYQSSQPCFEIETVILPSICGVIPTTSVCRKAWKHIQGLPLADPQFDIPREVDMLLGSEIYSLIVRDGIRIGGVGEPAAINSAFGWILTGRVDCVSSVSNLLSYCTTIDISLEASLKKFWELEEVPSIKQSSPDDVRCEQMFNQTVRRNEKGRYIVELPFRSDSPEFGNSYSFVLRRFLSLESKLTKNPSLHKSYCDFMQDYVDSGHMSPISTFPISSSAYYIPHHCVLKPDSPTTKVRVVFDASMKSSNNISLNDALLPGPKLQKDIVSLLLHFRYHKITLVCDIKQMYRQILITPEHRKYQRILWRFSPDEQIQHFELNTVTYGVSSAPYLALRTIIQLAQDEQVNFPLASQVLQSDIFVDDIVTGCNSVNEALALKGELTELLQRGGFDLHKWGSNSEELIASGEISHSFDADNFVKILGLCWLPGDDVFSYKAQSCEKECTKRNILSEVARIYDPLGFLAPLSFFAKHLIQQLWSLGIGWDEIPPQNIVENWLKYKEELHSLADLRLPRRLLIDNFQFCELHAFCDASELGYAVVTYFRFMRDDKISVFFVYAKSKVAPLKRITIPRLELCAAVLLSNVVNYIVTTFQTFLEFSKIYAWSDSTVALSWIKSSAHRWKTFVSNRVSHIQERVAPNLWYHIRGTENPADCASRGLLPKELLSHPSWWAGPSWLSLPHESWPGSVVIPDIEMEVSSEEKAGVMFSTLHESFIDELVERFSSYRKIQGIVAFCLRFGHNVRTSEKISGHLSNLELHNATILLVKYVQSTVFAEDISNLMKGKRVSKPLRKLSLFLDENGVVRVGGRLRFSHLSDDAKYPMLLPRSHRLTELIIEHFHRIHLHPGLQTLKFLLFQQFWILSARRAISHVLSHCYRCFRAKPVPLEPSMGNLPPSRISQSKAFSHTGVDFAGPVSVKLSKHRGGRSTKAYICVFVCMSTKAIHLELVSELSAEAFLAALRRFIARRGRCSHLYSDCGTNFVGANKLLLSYAQGATENEAILWHFNPPSAPHFGGLWEAGVKSVKSHLIRVIGEQVLTFEEFTTLLAQIEAVLNSRPLCAASSDPNDLSALTPGHFLTLEPLSCPPDEDLQAVTLNRLSKWQLIQRCHQDFWRRWSMEYLHTLQQRSKWNKTESSLAIDSLVLIQDNNTSPLKWKLGRVVELHSGSDHIARVATVKTMSGLLKRPLVKLCPLPSY